MRAPRVNPADVERALEQGCPDETLQQLHAFGVLMVDEIRQRTGALDTKGLVVLGWGTAIIGYLLGHDFVTAGWPLRVATIVPGTIAAYAVAHAYGATCIRPFDWPSDYDWFPTDLFTTPVTLRRYHLMSLLETHQNHSLRNAQKLAALQRAQFALVFASILTLILAVLEPFLTHGPTGG